MTTLRKKPEEKIQKEKNLKGDAIENKLYI
jgi:hypothetical protein